MSPPSIVDVEKDDDLALQGGTVRYPIDSEFDFWLELLSNYWLFSHIRPMVGWDNEPI